MAFYDENTGQYSAGDLPPNITATPRRTPEDERRQMLTDPVTGNPVQSFMNNPGIQRMLAMQAAGGTGRMIPPGGGGMGSLPMLQMLAPYLSQQRGGGMSPLLQQMLPMMLAQQRQAQPAMMQGGMMQPKAPGAAMTAGGLQGAQMGMKNPSMAFNMYPMMRRG